jgi:hypothetical protein
MSSFQGESSIQFSERTEQELFRRVSGFNSSKNIGIINKLDNPFKTLRS